MDKIVLSAAGKVNIFLKVLSGEIDGFHHVETLYQSVDLRDRITLERGGKGIALETRGIGSPEGESNLVHRAATAYFEASGISSPISIKLDKKIPVGTGLGGGSADAAAVLYGLNILFDEKLSASTLIQIAGSLGSDVPFALSGGTALGWSRGCRLLTLSSLPSWPILICVPDLQVNTGDAYGLLDRSGVARKVRATRYDPADFYSLQTLEPLARNDFETVMMEAQPVLAEIKDTLLQLGGSIVLLTGTGSAVYSIFRNERERAGCEKVFRERYDHQVFCTRFTPDGLLVEELE